MARFYYTCTAMQGVRIIWCLFICSKCASLHDFLDDETTSNENVLGILLRRCRGISAFQMHFSLMRTQPICDWPGFQSTQIYVLLTDRYWTIVFENFLIYIAKRQKIQNDLGLNDFNKCYYFLDFSAQLHLQVIIKCIIVLFLWCKYIFSILKKRNWLNKTHIISMIYIHCEKY